MTASFAQIRKGLQGLGVGSVLVLTSCASLPPPTAELTAAQQSVARADASDAAQYAPTELARARSALSRAQAAMSAGSESDARVQASIAAAAADLARARSRQAQADAELARQRSEIAALRERLQVEDGR